MKYTYIRCISKFTVYLSAFLPFLAYCPFLTSQKARKAITISLTTSMHSKPTLANSSNGSNTSGGIEIQSGGIYINNLKWFQNVPSRQEQLVMCRLRLGLKAPALAWLRARALQNHKPGQKPKCWLGLAWPGFGLGQGLSPIQAASIA